VFESSSAERFEMIDCNESLSISAQCRLLSVNRTRVYYQPTPLVKDETIIANRVYEIWLESPFYGYRRITATLTREGFAINHKRVVRLMKSMNVRALYPGLNLSKSDGSCVYPYLLRDIVIDSPNQVWATDLTYIKLPTGFVYLMALIDIYSRKIIAWGISNTMDAAFCVSVLNEALLNFEAPGIMNTDQGSQYTSLLWAQTLTDKFIKISMDGKGRWADNIYVERLWRTIKYEHVYIYSCETIKALKSSLAPYIDFYNKKRLHQSLDYHTPNEVHQGVWKAKSLLHYSKKEGYQ
jgi:putative transposase